MEQEDWDLDATRSLPTGLDDSADESVVDFHSLDSDPEPAEPARATAEDALHEESGIVFRTVHSDAEAVERSSADLDAMEEDSRAGISRRDYYSEVAERRKEEDALEDVEQKKDFGEIPDLPPDLSERHWQSQEAADEQKSPGSASLRTTNFLAAMSQDPIDVDIDVLVRDPGKLRAFLTTPLRSQTGVLQCNIRREKSGIHRLFPRFTLSLRCPSGIDRVLMTAKKRPRNRTPNYWICMDDCMHEDDPEIDRTSFNFIGKLRSNFLGTEHVIYSDGTNGREKLPPDKVFHPRREFGCIMYVPPTPSHPGPRKMQVYLPRVTEAGDIEEWSSETQPYSSVLEAARQKFPPRAPLIHLVSKRPSWHPERQSYMLNFSGRVTMSSVKNFQLVQPDAQDAIIVQFGRVGKNSFTLDFQWPLSPVQAFALALSSMDFKVVVE